MTKADKRDLWLRQIQNDCRYLDFIELRERDSEFREVCEHKKSPKGRCSYASCPRQGEIKEE